MALYVAVVLHLQMEPFGFFFVANLGVLGVSLDLYSSFNAKINNFGLKTLVNLHEDPADNSSALGDITFLSC